MWATKRYVRERDYFVCVCFPLSPKMPLMHRKSGSVTCGLFFFFLCDLIGEPPLPLQLEHALAISHVLLAVVAPLPPGGRLVHRPPELSNRALRLLATNAQRGELRRTKSQTQMIFWTYGRNGVATYGKTKGCWDSFCFFPSEAAHIRIEDTTGV